MLWHLNTAVSQRYVGRPGDEFVSANSRQSKISLQRLLCHLIDRSCRQISIPLRWAAIGQTIIIQPASNLSLATFPFLSGIMYECTTFLTINIIHTNSCSFIYGLHVLVSVLMGFGTTVYIEILVLCYLQPVAQISNILTDLVQNLQQILLSRYR